MNFDKKMLLPLIAIKKSKTNLKTTFKPLLIERKVVLRKLIHMLLDSNRAKSNLP